MQLCIVLAVSPVLLFFLYDLLCNRTLVIVEIRQVPQDLCKVVSFRSLLRENTHTALDTVSCYLQPSPVLSASWSQKFG